MNKKLLSLVILFFLSNRLVAQISEGGKPLSMVEASNQSQKIILADQQVSYFSALSSNVPQVSLQPVNVAELHREDGENNLSTGLCRIGAVIQTDIKFPESGNLVTLADGNKIWFLQIKVPHAAALGLYFDQFHLPSNAHLFLFNKNGKQILGSFSSKNNSVYNSFATEKVQGDLVNVELDMDANADQSKVLFHINKVVQFYKSTDYLRVYSTDEYDQEPDNYFQNNYGQSSACEINAVCPLSTGYSIQRDATIHIEYLLGKFVFAASGTMMNNTRQDGTPYMLTASHVDTTNSSQSSTFSTWIFYFNYQTPTCTYTGSQPSTKQSMVGATFKARSDYDAAVQKTGKIVGDFLLLELSDTVPASYGAFLSGWNLTSYSPLGTCISFHHPFADVKKVSTSDNISALGSFNSGQANSHWQVFYDGSTGGIEEGSSGGGLFDPSGYLIGDLTGGKLDNPSCTSENGAGDEITNLTEYSKIGLNWMYVYQQPSTSATRLKDWLDPLNTGDTLMNSISTTLKPTAINSPQTRNLTFQIQLFPNPTSGVLNVKLNSPILQNIKIEVFNLIGFKVSELMLNQAVSGEYKIDLTNNASGIYMVRISSDNNSLTEKVLLSK
jgi:lysyl endopeptidase